MPKPSVSNYRVIEVTPVIDTAAYTSGDRLGATQQLPGVTRSGSDSFKGATLKSLTILESGSVQKVAIDLLFFDASPTVVSADNAAIDIASSELVDKLLGRITVAAADYTTIKSATNAEATVRGLNLVLKPVVGASDIYVVAVVRGAPTYVATSGLTFKYGIESN